MRELQSHDRDNFFTKDFLSTEQESSIVSTHQNEQMPVQPSGSREPRNANANANTGSIDIHLRRQQNSEFRFEVPWHDIPKTKIKDPLRKCKRTKTRAPQNLMNALKLAIVDKLTTAWLGWREDHPEVSRKSPGREIYRSITKQVRHYLIDNIFDGW